MFFLLDKVLYDNERSYDYYAAPRRNLSAPDSPPSFPTGLSFLESLMGLPPVEGSEVLNKEISLIEKGEPSNDELPSKVFSEKLGLETASETENNLSSIEEMILVADESLMTDEEREKEGEEAEDSVAEKGALEERAVFIHSDDSENEEAPVSEFCSHCGKQKIPMSDVRNAQGGLLCRQHGDDYKFALAMNPEGAKKSYINKYINQDGKIIQIIKRRPNFVAAKRERTAKEERKRVAKKPKKVGVAAPAPAAIASSEPKGTCCQCGNQENISLAAGPDGGDLCWQHDNEYKFTIVSKGLEAANNLYYRRVAEQRSEGKPNLVFFSVTDLAKPSHS